ncbi:MAG: hypothetical protein DRH24_18050 [Deltaproteobacteria bacterium]|nr:MAG: hypothetical protein DRH24_18050 [Deltaproteobacteria bacterium]
MEVKNLKALTLLTVLLAVFLIQASVASAKIFDATTDYITICEGYYNGKVSRVINETTIEDREASFHPGLAGRIIGFIDKEGEIIQTRLIVDNDEHTITVDHALNPLPGVGDPYVIFHNFQDLKDWSDNNGFGYIKRLGKNSFHVLKAIHVGGYNGAEYCNGYFGDTNVQALYEIHTFDHYALAAFRHSAIQFGYTRNEPSDLNYSTSDGVFNIVAVTSNAEIFGCQEKKAGTCNFYSSTFSNLISKEATLTVRGVIANTLLRNFKLEGGEYKAYRVTLYNFEDGISKPESLQTRDVKIYYQTNPRSYALQLYTKQTLEDITFEGIASEYLGKLGGGVTHELRNCYSPVWKFSFDATSPGRLERQYSFELKIVFNNTPLEGANVTIRNKYGDVVYNGLTDVNGEIPKQWLVAQYFDLIYPSGQNRNPYTLTVEKEGFQTVNMSFNISKPESWVLEMFQPEQAPPQEPDHTNLAATLFLGGLTLGFAFLSFKTTPLLLKVALASFAGVSALASFAVGAEGLTSFESIVQASNVANVGVVVLLLAITLGLIALTPARFVIDVLKRHAKTS